MQNPRLLFTDAVVVVVAAMVVVVAAAVVVNPLLAFDGVSPKLKSNSMSHLQVHKQD